MAKKLQNRRNSSNKQKELLGKGVSALFKSSETTEENVRALSGTVAMIPIGQIEVNPFQPRKEFDEDALNELSGSLKIHGPDPADHGAPLK